MNDRIFDLIVIGGGTGRDVVLAAEEHGLSVALIEDGPLGGTCHNRGCMPSKMLIHSADIAQAARSGARFGIHATVEEVDLPAMVRRVFAELDEERLEREAALDESDLVTWYRGEGRFVDARTLDVSGEIIRGERVVIAAGTRPIVPPIPGLDETPHLTSDDALRLTELPARLVIIGGGYIAAEMAHFFGSLGSDVTIVERADRLLLQEDHEIGAWFTQACSARHHVLLRSAVERVAPGDGTIEVHLDGVAQPLIADQLLVATGRRPNTDRLNLDAAGVEVDRNGFVVVDELLQTSAPGVWALGDVTGIMPLKHVAVRQARHLIEGLFDDRWRPVHYDVIPHAVFSSPQVAAVGRTEQELIDQDVRYRVGRHEFRHTGMGMALGENGIVKVLAGEDHTILGVHIVGPEASILVHEAVVAMTIGGRLDTITEAVHVHPALPQVLEAAAHAAAVAPVQAGGPA